MGGPVTGLAFGKFEMMLHTVFLVTWFALPVIVCAAALGVRRRVHPFVAGALCLATVIAGIFVLANYVWALDAHLLAEIEKYDPDSIEARRASENWASDTDRSFTLLLSPILTAGWYGGLFLLALGHRWIWRQLFPPQDVQAEVLSNGGEAFERDSDNGNPYQPPVVR